MTELELNVVECMVFAGWPRDEAIQKLEEVKSDAIEADHGFENERNNLARAKDETIEALADVLYNLRNA